MKLVTQPEGTRLCGQCCVAMLCDIDLEAASKLEERERTTHWYSALNQRWMKKVYVSDDDRHFQSHSLPADQEPPAGALVEVAVSGAWVPVRHVPGAWLSVLSSKLRRQRRSTRRSANRR